MWAQILGFKKWTNLLKASEADLELAKLIFDNQDKINQPDWEMYIARIDVDDAESKLEIYKHVFLNVEGHHSPFPHPPPTPNEPQMLSSKSPQSSPDSPPVSRSHASMGMGMGHSGFSRRSPERPRGDQFGAGVGAARA